MLVGDLFLIVLASSAAVLNAILIVCNHRRGDGRWASDGILIAMGAAFDLQLGVYVAVASLVRVVSGELVYDGSIWCKVNFIVERTLAVTCLNLVMLLALMRYLVIVRRYKSLPLLWFSISSGTFLLIFLITLLRSKSTKLYVYPSGLYCYPMTSKRVFIKDVFSNTFTLLCVPHLFIIPLCYLSIANHYKRLISNIYECGFATHVHRQIRGICILSAAYWVAFAPHIALVFLVRVFETLPSPGLDMLIYYLKTSSLIINALFPLLFHEEINGKLWELCT
ncbi:hypothetical protein DSO57_1018714 [Entomophthora muscae]|uniref:Uncharacterized protein n=1 Tax=Entomophthora muscae TaxID=34485 RepID=A0ACC2RIY4_9FUNG|nr:hypothetical protein DSO57_1018714 [Entomophthora muscae]